MSEKERAVAPSAIAADKPAATYVLPICLAIPAITGEVAPIGKDRTNPQQGYKFRGIEDVYAHLNLLLAKYRVSVLTEILNSEHDQYSTAAGKAMFRHRVKIRYHLVAGDGSKLTTDSEGEGMDTGDKATPKAFSTAYKTMAFQLFCIPTGEKVDSEEESPEVVVKPKYTAEQQTAKFEELAASLKTVLEHGEPQARDLLFNDIKVAADAGQIDAIQRDLLRSIAKKKQEKPAEAKA